MTNLQMGVKIPLEDNSALFHNFGGDDVDAGPSSRTNNISVGWFMSSLIPRGGLTVPH